MTKKKLTKKSKSNANVWLLIGAFVIMSGIVWFALRSDGESTDGARPLVATLSPTIFDGKAREAYQVAKDIPEVLADLPCFCGCANVGHKSNLFCFKDNHGEECAMCQDIALVARAMHDQGSSTDKIRDEIIAKYSSYAP